MACCDIWEVFDEKDNLIKEYKHWKLLVNNRNKTLGNCVAIIKRHIEAFSDITTDEMLELTQLVKDAEGSLKKAFGYEKINWVMTMMKDMHLHFHILPRYSSTKHFAGLDWEDAGWPELPKKKEPVSKEVLQQVKEAILEGL
jgi:diadenosine tetraphosphate (Ap4A) HIT family hydrolase